MNTEIIKRAKKGDINAFEDIILYYKNDLYKIARTRLNRNEDIDDAIQETILSAYQSLNKLINVSKFKSWIITILINKCNYIYKQNVNIISYDYIEGEKLILTSEELDSNIEFDDLLNELDKDEKTILVLYYCEGYKTIEIAKMMHINNSTVRTKMHRARKKLKLIEEENVYE